MYIWTSSTVKMKWETIAIIKNKIRGNKFRTLFFSFASYPNHSANKDHNRNSNISIHLKKFKCNHWCWKVQMLLEVIRCSSSLSCKYKAYKELYRNATLKRKKNKAPNYHPWLCYRRQEKLVSRTKWMKIEKLDNRKNKYKRLFEFYVQS